MKILNIHTRLCAITFITAFTLMLLTGTSCSKLQQGTPEEASKGTKIQPAAVKSTVKYYGKDATTGITFIDATPGYTHYVVYTVGPFDVEAGDVVTVHCQRQFGLASGAVAPILAAGGILATTDPLVDEVTEPGFIAMVCGWAGANMTADDGGREVITRTGSYKFEQAASHVYINAIFYGQALTGAAGSGDLSLPTGNYGELVAVLESGVTWQNTTTTNLPYNADPDRKRYMIPFTPVLNVHNNIGPVSIPANSQVDVRYDAEATTFLGVDGTNQTYGRNIIMGTAATSTSGTNLTKQTQVGITHREHHSEWSNAGGLQVVNPTTAHFNSVIYSNGWSGETLYMDPGSANLYNKMQLEVRPYKFFAEDNSNNTTTIDGAQRVLYSIPVGAVTAGEVIEVRYQAAFGISGAAASVDSKIVRATSATATSGVMVQDPLVNGFHPNYGVNQLMHSTAEKIATTTSTPQFYNVVVWKIGGTGTVIPQAVGEMEVIRR